MPTEKATEYRIHISFLTLFAEAISLYLFIALVFAAIARSLENSIFMGKPLSITFWPLFFLAGAAFVINYWLTNRTHRVITFLLVNLIIGGFVIRFLIINIFNTDSFFPAWSNLDKTEWFFLQCSWVTFLLCSLRLWYSGLMLARKTPANRSAIARFEVTVFLNFVIVLIAALNSISLPKAAFWLVVNILTNCTILALTSPGTAPVKLRLLGPGVLAIVLFPISFIASYLLPSLSDPASMLLQASQPILNTFTAILVFIISRLYNYKKFSPEPASSSPNTVNELNGEAVASTAPGWLTTITQILFWGLIISLVLVVVALLGYLAYRILVRLLRIQTATIPKSSSQSWLPNLITFLKSCSTWLIAKFVIRLRVGPKKLNIILAYQVLEQWGAKRRIPRQLHETPYEYLERLKQKFPEQINNIQYITENYVDYTYGTEGVGEFSLDKLKIAVRGLK